MSYLLLWVLLRFWTSLLGSSYEWNSRWDGFIRESAHTSPLDHDQRSLRSEIRCSWWVFSCWNERVANYRDQILNSRQSLREELEQHQIPDILVPITVCPDPLYLRHPSLTRRFQRDSQRAATQTRSLTSGGTEVSFQAPGELNGCNTGMIQASTPGTGDVYRK